jgi:hypothetical protein
VAVTTADSLVGNVTLAVAVEDANDSRRID